MDQSSWQRSHNHVTRNLPSLSSKKSSVASFLNLVPHNDLSDPSLLESPGCHASKTLYNFARLQCILYPPSVLDQGFLLVCSSSSGPRKIGPDKMVTKYGMFTFLFVVTDHTYGAVQDRLSAIIVFLNSRADLLKLKRVGLLKRLTTAIYGMWASSGSCTRTGANF